MAFTLTSGEHDQIRLMISSDIDDDDLTDAEIESDTVLGAAESYVNALLTVSPSTLGAEATRAYRRMVKTRCAWLLVPSFADQIAETEGPLSARYEGNSSEKKRELLEEQMNADLKQLSDAGHAETDSDFTVAFDVFQIN